MRYLINDVLYPSVFAFHGMILSDDVLSLVRTARPINVKKFV